MMELLVAALPWIVLGFSVAFCMVAVEANRTEEKVDDASVPGMLAGAALGLFVGICLGHMVIGLASGILLGLGSGMYIKR